MLEANFYVKIPKESSFENCLSLSHLAFELKQFSWNRREVFFYYYYYFFFFGGGGGGEWRSGPTKIPQIKVCALAKMHICGQFWISIFNNKEKNLSSRVPLTLTWADRVVPQEVRSNEDPLYFQSHHCSFSLLASYQVTVTEPIETLTTRNLLRPAYKLKSTFWATVEIKGYLHQCIAWQLKFTVKIKG